MNPRVIDNNWLSSFKIIKLLKKEIFSELYLIQMQGGKQKYRILRKVKKIIFKDPQQGIEDYRFSLEELL